MTRALPAAEQTAGRSSMSDNWRMRSNVQPGIPSTRAAANPPDGQECPPRVNLPSRAKEQSKEQLNEQFKIPPKRQLRGEHDPTTLRAITEGRRLYVGNMPYMAKLRDVEKLFADDPYKVALINMSIDPFTARNPSYCFVELETNEQADHAIRELNGKIILNRPVKIGLCTVKQEGTANPKGHEKSPCAFERWTRTDASKHWRGYGAESHRLMISGLPRMSDHFSVDADVRAMFSKFKIEAVSKVVVKQPSLPDGRTHPKRLVFVDFSTAEDADEARELMDGEQAWGVKIRVGLARQGGSEKVDERELWELDQIPVVRRFSRETKVLPSAMEESKVEGERDKGKGKGKMEEPLDEGER